MKTTHPETDLEELKLQCALALPVFEGRALIAGVTPQTARTAFDLLPDDEKLAFIAAVMEEIQATHAANQLAPPTNAATTITKIDAQRRKFQGFRLTTGPRL